MSWLSLRVLPAGEPEAALAALFAAGAQGVHEDGAALLTHFPPGIDVLAVATAVRAADPGASVTVGRAADTDWTEAWKDLLSVQTIDDLRIAPPWLAEGLDPAQTIVVDPGMAFGTGTHASTRLVLEEMQDLADTPARVLDVGCGSGILAIAAAKLWPGTEVLGVDNDPLAVSATRDNAAANGVAIAAGDALPDGTFPLVLANIQAHVLRELKDALVARTKGILIMSGLLTPQARAVADEYAAAGMTIVTVRPSATDPAWSVVVATS